jgi:7,8-dihydropterin-6-yl-methyl-4-(beta-D-ribofuranosyl)aminobenzene 5'-phosphate synthase
LSAINTSEGVVVIIGCSQPGIDRILQAATAINPRVHLVVGGLNLVVANDQDIEKAVTALHDTFKVEYVAPGHCTDEPAFSKFKKAYGDPYLYAGLGSSFPLTLRQP